MYVSIYSVLQKYLTNFSIFCHATTTNVSVFTGILCDIANILLYIISSEKHAVHLYKAPHQFNSLHNQLFLQKQLYLLCASRNWNFRVARRKPLLKDSHLSSICSLPQANQGQL